MLFLSIERNQWFGHLDSSKTSPWGSISDMYNKEDSGHAGEIFLTWLENTLKFSQRVLEEVTGVRSDHLYLSCCPYDPNPDEQMWLDGWFDHEVHFLIFDCKKYLNIHAHSFPSLSDVTGHIWPVSAFSFTVLKISDDENNFVMHEALHTFLKIKNLCISFKDIFSCGL